VEVAIQSVVLHLFQEQLILVVEAAVVAGQDQVALDPVELVDQV
jgi:hypothetical protein